MKRFMLMHIGFEKPTPEIVAAWKQWFSTAASRTIENAGLRHGHEISHGGVADLPMDGDAITGYTIIETESREDAETLARANPFIKGIRIYEIASH